MIIKYGEPSKFGPGIRIELTGNEVARAIDVWLHSQRVIVRGPRTVTVNGDLCNFGEVLVDSSGFVITAEGEKLSGRGPGHE
jgi:hypothetical protein